MATFVLLAACQPVPATTTPEAATTTPPEEATTSPTAAAPAAVDLTATSWVLSSLDGSLPLPGTAVTLQFNADGTATGTARFLTTLPRAASYRLDGNRLDIRSAADQIIIVANRAP